MATKQLSLCYASQDGSQTYHAMVRQLKRIKDVELRRAIASAFSNYANVWVDAYPFNRASLFEALGISDE